MVSQRTIKLALLVELPILAITFSLLAWAIAALADAHKFLDIAVYDRTGTRGAEYGLNLGTQILTLTTTHTGSTALYSYVLSTITRTYSRSGSMFISASATTVPVFAGRTTGTVTVTATRTIYPGAQGSAYYADLYSQAQVNPEDLRSWKEGEYASYLSSLAQASSTSAANGSPSFMSTSAAASSTSSPGASPTPAPLDRRDGSWSEGYSYDSTHDGLYYVSWENLTDVALWIGLFSVCLVSILLRIVGNILYAVTTPRKSTAVTLLCTAVIAVTLLIGCGVAAWIFFAMYQTLGASDVRATLAFWAISTLLSIPVMIFAAIEVNKYNKNAKFGSGRGSEADDASGTAIGHSGRK